MEGTQLQGLGTCHCRALAFSMRASAEPQQAQSQDAPLIVGSSEHRLKGDRAALA